MNVKSANIRKQFMSSEIMITFLQLHQNLENETTQSKIIEFIATRNTHTHAHTLESNEICAANSESKRASRENLA